MPCEPGAPFYSIVDCFHILELSIRVKELEKMNKSLTADRSSLESELDALKDKISVSHKELKDFNTQRKKTMEEFSDLNDKLAEIRSQKLKLTRLVREKEEEIGIKIFLFSLF